MLSPAALRDKDFRWFWVARTTSMVGSSMAPVALAFAVLHVDRSPGALAQVMTVRTAMLVVFLLVGGVVADRLPRRVVIQSAHVITMITQGVAAALVISGHATVLNLTVVEGLNGAVSAFTMPAMQGIIPQLTTREHLQQANALMSFSRSATVIGGPLVAGALVAGPGAGWALAVDALTYLVAVLALMPIRIPPGHRSESSPFRDLLEGWSVFRSHTWLWVVVLAFSTLNAIQAGAWGVLGPYVAETDARLGVHGWATVLASQGAGAVLMTLVLMHRPLRRPLLAGMIGCSLTGLPMLMLGLHPTAWWVAPLAFLSAAGLNVFGTGWDVTLQERVPQHQLSRVYSYDMLGSFVAIPVGTTVVGLVAVTLPPSAILLALGPAYSLIALATLLVPSIRAMRRLNEE